MNIFQKYNIRPMPMLKVAGVALVGFVAVLFVFQMVGSTFTSVLNKRGVNSVAPSTPGGAYYDGAQMGEESAPSYGGDMAVGYGGTGGALSVRNVTGSLPYPGVPPAGDDAEAYEVTSYNAIIEARDFSHPCGVLADLKGKDYVIFQNANEHDHGCDYAFKVKNANVNEILDLLKTLDPKELSQNTYTIQQLIIDFTSEVEILEKKRASIDATLEEAIKAYDQITGVATRTQDAESLARIIESKIQIIERLTQQRIAISAQLEQLSRAKADQLDRLAYTYFHVNVYESKFIDGELLKDSWKAAVREFVRNINKSLQDMTINFVALLFVAMQFILYFFVLLVIAKYVWRAALSIWKK